METTQPTQSSNQLQDTTDGHVFKKSNFLSYLLYTLLLNKAVGGEKLCSFNDNGTLLELHYRNKLGTGSYIGLHKDPALIEALKKEWEVRVPWATFKVVDLSTGGDDYSAFTAIEADKVISLNLPEGISRNEFYYYLQNLYLCGNPEATYFIRLPKSTALISEHDIKFFINTYFNVVQRFGVHGTLGDFKPVLNDWLLKMYEGLLPYYDEEFMAGFIAPFLPDHCQQNMWVLKRKQ
jgi:hypothetical protein